LHSPSESELYHWADVGSGALPGCPSISMDRVAPGKLWAASLMFLMG